MFFFSRMFRFTPKVVRRIGREIQIFLNHTKLFQLVFGSESNNIEHLEGINDGETFPRPSYGDGPTPFLGGLDPVDHPNDAHAPLLHNAPSTKLVGNTLRAAVGRLANRSDDLPHDKRIIRRGRAYLDRMADDAPHHST